MRGKKKQNLKPVCSQTKSKKLFGSFFKRKVKPTANPANPQAHVDAPIPEVNPVQDGNPPPVQNRFFVSDKPQANAKHLVVSIRALGPEQLGLLSKGDENFDETVAFNKVEEIGRNFMKFIYVAHVLHWWVHVLYLIFVLKNLRLVICSNQLDRCYIFHRQKRKRKLHFYSKMVAFRQTSDYDARELQRANGWQIMQAFEASH